MFLLSLLAEKPPAPPKRDSIRVTLREVPGPTPNQRPSPGPPSTRPPGTKRARPLPKPLAGLSPRAAPRAPRAAPAPPGPRDLSKVKLFDPAVVGRSIARADAAEISPHVKQRSTGNDADAPDSPLAEKARVNARVAQQLREAAAEGDVMAGLRASCDDGLDQGYDGLIDCADPMCRELDLCRGTAEYTDHRAEEIPDGGEAIERILQASQEGRVRKVAVVVDLEHASPADLSIVLISPAGTRAELRPESSEEPYFRAYYVPELAGEPAAGRWRLVIQDHVPGGTGRLKRWVLWVTS